MSETIAQTLPWWLYTLIGFLVSTLGSISILILSGWWTDKEVIAGFKSLLNINKKKTKK